MICCCYTLLSQINITFVGISVEAVTVVVESVVVVVGAGVWKYSNQKISNIYRNRTVVLVVLESAVVVVEVVVCKCIKITSSPIVTESFFRLFFEFIFICSAN